MHRGEEKKWDEYQKKDLPLQDQGAEQKQIWHRLLSKEDP